ncbi:MAG: DUF3857 and transglutaminase domain-containing protein [Candidatus Omnitrophota bacterium]
MPTSNTLKRPQVIIFLFLVFVLLCGCRNDNPDTRSKPKQASSSGIVADSSEAEYPQAGALILACDEEIEVTAEAKLASSLHYLVKILNKRGREDFSRVQIDYDAADEKPELIFARTIRPDGKVIEAASGDIRDSYKYPNFPFYSNARVFTISFPEASEGSLVEYSLKITRSRMLNNKDFAADYLLQTKEPVISANFSISLPKEFPLYVRNINENYNYFKASLAPTIEEGKFRRIYRWQFKDIPAIIREPNMPPWPGINPGMLFSTFSSWGDVYQWWWALARDKIKAGSAVKEKVLELTAGKNTAEEKIRAIYNFCAREIRYCAVEFGDAGYEPHQAEEVFKNKYGDCVDRVLLLVAMLKEQNFLAYPVLISTRYGYNLDPNFPSALFNHCIAAAVLNGKLIFMDPSVQTCSFGDLPSNDQGRRVLVIKEDGYAIEETPLFPGRHNLLQQVTQIKINSDESIAAQKTVYSFGAYDQGQRYWLMFNRPEKITQALKDKIQEVSIGAKLEYYNTENLDGLDHPVLFSYAFRGPEYLSVAGALRILPQLANLDTAPAAKDSRRYPLDFQALDIQENVVEIMLPDNLTLDYIPKNVSENSPWMSFSAEYTQRNRVLYLQQRTELKKTIIPAQDYPEFKAFLERLAKKIKERVILKKKG